MSLQTPDDWSMLAYYSSRIVQDLAQHIADQAVGLNPVDKRVLATYQDAVAVDAMLRALHHDAQNTAMTEAMAR